MDIKALQTRLRDFAVARDWQPYHAPKNLAMALMVEAAELLELFQWQTLTESRGFTRNVPDKERVADEIADVLLYLLQLADHTDVDVEQAVERKLRKNAEKYPAKHPEPQPAAPAPMPESAPAASKVHLLVDWENVQPTGDALQALVPEGSDVWLFHGPHQKVDDTGHRQAFGERVTQVPRSGTGRNALDFQLSYYVGYIAARQPKARFVVVANDQGYDPMLEHARELGFDARRCTHHKAAKQPPAPPPAAPVVPSPAPVAQVKLEKKKAVTKAAPASTKATRQDMQQLVKLLDGLAVPERPARKDMLVALLQNHLGETSVQSPRVAHALAQLQALKRVTLKKDVVSYPLPQPAPAPAKKAAARAVSKVAAPKPTAAKVAHAVLASLQKMPKNKPARRTGLLKFIETHAAKAADPQSMAQQVCALLEARQEVALSPDGKGVTYPGLKAKKAASA
jgi:NTP pyrophosphatase (non-canonical NTP hydrolase)